MVQQSKVFRGGFVAFAAVLAVACLALVAEVSHPDTLPDQRLAAAAIALWSVAAVGSAVVCRLAGLQICLQAAQSMHLHSFFVGCII
jgi:hypothetical protein